jgi:2-polyprenyl-3-methyl-5-hydroxy-6-metoxy-1,4-benzoquinol methylase
MPWNFVAGWPPSYPAFGRMRALVAVEEASNLRPKRTLEIASGDGSLSAVLATRGCAVVVNDLREDHLKRNVQAFRNCDQIQVAPGNVFDLDPNRLGKFDLIVACEVIEHIAHSGEFLRQLGKFLDSSGRVLLTTPNGAYFRNELPTLSQVVDFNILERRQFAPDADGHLFLITPSELLSLAEENGFEVEAISVWGTPFLTGHCKLAMFSSRLLARGVYEVEKFVQRLRDRWRQRLCFALTAVLRPRVKACATLRETGVCTGRF